MILHNRHHGDVKKGFKEVYIGRGSIFGNPYSHLDSSYPGVIKTATREDAVERHLTHLRHQYRTDPEVKRELDKLALRYLCGERLALSCYCAPHRCHGENILKAVEGIAERNGYTPMLTEETIVFIDFETGGLDPLKHPILTVGLITVRRGQLEDPLYIKIRANPDQVDPNALKKNNIDLNEHNNDPETVRRAEARDLIIRYAREAARKSGISSRDLRLGGHNMVGFDIKFLNKLLDNQLTINEDYKTSTYLRCFSKVDVVDTILIAQFLCDKGLLQKPIGANGKKKGFNLGYLASLLDVDLTNAHNAMDDIIATAEVFIKLCSVNEPILPKEVIT